MKTFLALILLFFSEYAYSTGMMAIVQGYCLNNECDDGLEIANKYFSKGSCLRVYPQTQAVHFKESFTKNEYWLVMEKQSYYRNSSVRNKAIQLSKDLYRISSKTSYLIYEAEPVQSLANAEADFCLRLYDLHSNQGYDPIALLIYK